MGVWPKRVITKLKRVQRVLLREHKRMVLAGHWVHASGVLTKGMEYLQAVDGMLAQHSPAHTAWCYRHNCFCEVPRPPLSEGLHFHCAGTTCVDFSRRSQTQLQLLGVHMLVFACWGWSRSLHNEPLILHECVPNHPSSFLLQRYVGRTHVVRSFVLCPADIGHPCTRRRRFTLAVHRARLVTRLVRSPSEIWTFKVIADADVYFSALPVEVDAYLSARGVSSWRELLPAGAQKRHIYIYIY